MAVMYGYTLSSEEHPPARLVEQAAEAERRGFDFVSISDHFHPWVTAQGHSPFVWTTLGAIAARTTTLELAVGVTCPIMRLHPAIVAHASATTSLLSDGRFALGLGTGEALNEHVFGQRWPRPEVRRRMLREAIGIIRGLWSGETLDHEGEFYTVENARLFDPPEQSPPLIVSGFGGAAIELAAELGDGYWGHSPDREATETFEKAGGTGPKYAQITLCWADDVDNARKTVHEVWPTAGLTGQLSQDLPTWTHFESATAPLTIDQTTESVPCGPDPQPILESVRAFEDAGYDHLYFHQIGPDQLGFFDFWTSILEPALRETARV